MSNDHSFSTQQKKGVYRAIRERRDIRAQFVDTQVPDQVLRRLLEAAHHAPSVGFMQPWNFLVVRNPAVKKEVHRAFERAHARSAAMFPPEKREKYKKFKLEGIREAPVNLLITCDRTRTGQVVIGRTVQPEMDLYSTVCAVQNLWLAARAEGVGVGWVSIVEERDLQEIFGLPEHVRIIAYLCVGYVSHFPDRPELEKAGWLPRLDLDELVYYEQWGRRGKAG
jgi:5,6-dimethylbenzimidazole synthase